MNTVRRRSRIAMTTTESKVVGWALMVLGLLVLVFSHAIVFPGLEILVGIETIVGKENVSYQPDGSYDCTNPVAMMRWVASVAGVGLLIGGIGLAILLRAHRKSRRIVDERVQTYVA